MSGHMLLIPVLLHLTLVLNFTQSQSLGFLLTKKINVESLHESSLSQVPNNPESMIYITRDNEYNLLDLVESNDVVSSVINTIVILELTRFLKRIAKAVDSFAVYLHRITTRRQYTITIAIKDGESITFSSIKAIFMNIVGIFIVVSG